MGVIPCGRSTRSPRPSSSASAESSTSPAISPTASIPRPSRSPPTTCEPPRARLSAQHGIANSAARSHPGQDRPGRLRRLRGSIARARPSASLSQDRAGHGFRRMRLLRSPFRSRRGTGGQASGMNLADPRHFLYRNLDPDAARSLAHRHLSSHDDGELYLQYASSEAFGFDDGRLKTADYHSTSGFGLRGVTGETTAFAHANEISEAAIDRAAATLKLLDPRKGEAALPPARTNRAMYGADDPLNIVPFADKV